MVRTGNSMKIMLSVIDDANVEWQVVRRRYSSEEYPQPAPTTAIVDVSDGSPVLVCAKGEMKEAIIENSKHANEYRRESTGEPS